MIEIKLKKTNEPKRHIRYFDKDALLSLATCFHFSVSRPLSPYEDDILACIIDYIEHSIDNRNCDDYEFEEDRMLMSDVHLIVKLGEKKQYIQINEDTETYNFVDNINEASLFEYTYNDTLSYYLNKIRKEYTNDSFVAIGVSRQLFNEPLQNLITKQKLHLD